MARGREPVVAWRSGFENDELNALHADGFGHRPLVIDWRGQVERHSLGWVCARRGASLVGFVNVAWDGGVHAFILDTLVALADQRKGLATRMVAVAAAQAKAAGCEWLHVDFEPRLSAFYLDACHFSPTGAGLIALRGQVEP